MSLSVKELLEEKLMTIYDPEFPIADIYTLGLIYEINVDENNQKAEIVMTFTSPTCPAADLLEESVKNALCEIIPAYEHTITITFDPARTPDKMRDDDLKRMFE
jgi:metal-sulfur cluster biosynthetic enzyme